MARKHILSRRGSKCKIRFDTRMFNGSVDLHIFSNRIEIGVCGRNS